MLLFYIHIITPRLQYVCDIIFKEMMAVEYEFTTDKEKYNGHAAARINYTGDPKTGGFHIAPEGLLFEKDVKVRLVECFTYNNDKAFFKTTGTNFPFDVFAATFYLLSRYEEYLPHTKDLYGRYAHENSVAFKEGFLQEPLINKWITHFAAALQQQFPGFNYSLPAFHFQPTYDIDIAYSFKHKGFLRNAGGFLQQPSLGRIKVLLGFKKDPFDSYSWLQQLHVTHQLQPIYFFLMADKNSLYDKNILPAKMALQQLIRQHAGMYPIGIHPSWQSGDHNNLLLSEKQSLEKISGQSITRSRQHYIRFNLPQGYRQLIDAGITADYSMGYGSINGFRASFANSFFWYDLEKENTTSLRLHPFCYMEANSMYEQHFTPAQAGEEIKHYLAACKNAHGNFISIWHNQFFGSDPLFNGWREVYENFVESL